MSLEQFVIQIGVLLVLPLVGILLIGAGIFLAIRKGRGVDFVVTGLGASVSLKLPSADECRHDALEDTTKEEV